jgi:hypothetical protein
LEHYDALSPYKKPYNERSKAMTRNAKLAHYKAFGDDFIEYHHTLPVAENSSVEEKLDRLDWHLKNLWVDGWKTIVPVKRSVHVALHSA